MSSFHPLHVHIYISKSEKQQQLTISAGPGKVFTCRRGRE
jgi:hypothetical protein